MVKKINMPNELRKFNGGAVRDSDKGKIHYLGIRHPLVEHSFGLYMLKHQTCADGTMRKADNWWDGWSESVSLDSMLRHVADLEALHAGLFVYKERDKNGEHTHILTKELKNLKDVIGFEQVTEEDCLNAIKFNCNSYLLEILK